MKTVSITEAKTHFSRILREVERGETFVFTRHGTVIARLVPAGKSRDVAIAAIEDIHRLRRERMPTLGGITTRELVEEGRE